VGRPRGEWIVADIAVALILPGFTYIFITRQRAREERLQALKHTLKPPEKRATATDSSKDGYNYLVNKYLDNKSNDIASSTQSNHRTPPKMAVIGIGGAGVATINRFTSISGMPTKRFVVIDSDVTAIRNSKAHTKITLEKTEGSIDDIKAKMVIYEAEDKIMKATSGVGVDVAFIIVGTGGKTGFHAWNIVAEMLQEKGILTIVFAIKPFSFEEGYRHLNATVASKSQSGIDIFVEVSNDRMLQAVPKSTPLHEAFKIMDYTLVDAIKGVYDCISSGSKDKRKIQAIINRFVLNLVDNHE
jgi:cell division GTPase FtsZ